ncbi:MAG: MBL fold metallo-hydrolase [Chloroflexi bacterium]|nr:MBL fold metallo-hydrolase [Chloroflexota bacterium]
MAIHSFSVGKIRCVVVPDGGSIMPLADLAGIFPPDPDVQAGILALPDTQGFSMNCLLIESDGQLILLDTGLGTLNPAHSPALIANLREAGAAPEAIDIVVITHGHGDHMGGGVDDAGNLSFPNARYMMTRLDWDHWTGPAVNPAAERCLSPLREFITLIEPDDLIAPGVRALPALGHTPGHIGVVIESQGEKLMDVVDAMHHPLQVAHPTWSPRFDTDPVKSAETRRALLEQAAAESCRLMTYHFAFPGLGTVRAKGDSFTFDAVS